MADSGREVSSIGDANTTTTTLFLSNLHCPTCIHSIEDSLYSLNPAPLAIFHSIISHSVVIRHHQVLTIGHISEALESVGFEIHSAFQGTNDSPHVEVFRPYERQDDATWEASLEQAVSRWRQRRTGSATKQAHMAHCESCRLEESGERTESLRNKQQPLSSMSLDGVDEPASSSDPQLDSVPEKEFVVVESCESDEYQASLAITGMTCGSCVSAISQAVDELGFVRSVDVNLLTNSASVIFQGESHAEDVVSAIESAGYDATIENVKSTKTPLRQNEVSNTWKASFSVGGMTCSSCVGNINRAVEQLPFVEKVEINLVSNSGTVLFRGKDNLSAIKQSIEDSGYEATVDEIVNVGQHAAENAVRNVSIRINGMYCKHCPPRILDALERTYGKDVNIEKPPNLKDGILKIRYLSRPPEFTIRQIMQTLRGVDRAFEPEIFHPPTLEQRSQDIQRRERNHILLRLALSIAIAIPTFTIGVVIMDLVSSENAARMYLMRPLWNGVSRAVWALFILSTPVYFFAADIFHRRASKELWVMWRPGSVVPLSRRFYRFGSMNMLMSLGTSIAYFASVAELAMSATQTSGGSAVGDFYFDSVVFLTMFLLIGRYLEAFSKAKTGDAVKSLGNLRPSQALLVDQAKDVTVPVDYLEIDDIIRVPNGSSPPFDGVILDGQTKFDESSLTGESRLVPKEVGDTVFSGTVNRSGPITIRLTSVSGTSMLDQIIRVVREGQARRAPIERTADLITGYFVPGVVLVGVVTWVIWLALGESGALPSSYKDTKTGGWPLWSFRFAIAVFVVACPCGIGLAAPTALFVGGGMAARHGILVKGGGEAFQEASTLDFIVFDKTGTLTQGGDPTVTDYNQVTDLDKDAVFALARKLEEGSSHPIAKAIASYCMAIEAPAIEIQDLEEVPGRGMKGLVNADFLPQGTSIIIGNEALMSDFKATLSPSTTQTLNEWKAQGKSIALLGIKTGTDWNLAAAFAISDPLRPEAVPTVTALRKRGIDVWMLSGDNPTTAQAVGAQVGIPSSNIIAGVLPDQKAEKIRFLQRTPTHARTKSKHQQPHRNIVAMVGDGINDAPALAAADVGIAIGSGADVALSSAAFVLVSSDLSALLTLVDLARAVFRRVWFNFAWAAVYNVVATPVAAGVLYPISSGGAHVRLDPVWASLAMALSSVSVVCSSLLLRTRVPVVGFREQREKTA